MSIYSEHGRAVADILQRGGARQAELQRQTGEIWGKTVASIGETAGHAIDQYGKEQKEKKKEEREQREAAELNVLFSSGTMPNPQQVIKVVGPERGLRIVAGMAALQKPPIDPVKDYGERQNRLKDTLLGMLALPKETRAAIYPGVRSGLLTQNVIKPEDAPEAYDEDFFNRMVNYGQEPEKPKAPGVREVKTRNPDGSETIQIVEDTPGQTFTSAPPPKPPPSESGFTLGPNQVRYDATGKRIATGPGGTGSGGGLSAANARLVEAVIANPNIYNTLTPTAKTAIAADLAQRGFKGFEQAGAGKPPTGAQNKTLGFFNRAKQASEDLEGIEDQIATRSLGKQSWDAVVPNFAQTDIGRQYTQSQRAFTEARLRKDSGAAIPPQEFANDRQTYFVQPGDDQTTIDNKRRARSALLASIAFEAGPALHGFYGDEADGMIEGYRDAARKKAAVGNQGAPPAPAGWKYVAKPGGGWTAVEDK